MKPRLLVLELWGLGDLVIASPFLRVAAEKFSVTLLAKPMARELQPRFWPAVEILPFTAPWTAFRRKYQLWRWPWPEIYQLRRRLRAQAFDHAVSARWDPRDHWLLKLSGARDRMGFPRSKSQRWLTQPLARTDPSGHRLESWRTLGAALGLELPPRAAAFPSRPARPSQALIHTGAQRPLRVWPLENFQAIARRLRENHLPVQIACDRDQRDWWQRQGETVVCPQSIPELLAWLDQGGIFIGNDSGPGHLAAACGLPTFTFFGPQLPAWFMPLHPAAEAMPGHACPYKPCLDYCRFAKPFCLQDVTVAEAWPQIEAFVAKHQREPRPPPALASKTS